MSKGNVVSVGAGCDICGFHVTVPRDNMWLVDLIMGVHELVVALWPRHRRRFHLWLHAWARGVILEHPWNDEDAL